MKCLGKTPAVLQQVDREEGDAAKKKKEEVQEVCALHLKGTGKFGRPGVLTSLRRERLARLRSPHLSSDLLPGFTASSPSTSPNSSVFLPGWAVTVNLKHNSAHKQRHMRLFTKILLARLCLC